MLEMYLRIKTMLAREIKVCYNKIDELWGMRLSDKNINIIDRG